MQIDQDTTVTVGFIATAIGGITGVAKWLFNIKKDVDRHTEQLDSIEESLEKQDELHEKVSELSERTARMETKIDLLIEDKIKR